jgi:hypothetical protein
MWGDREFSKMIEDLISQFVADPPLSPVELRKIVKDRRILPLHWDFGGCYAVRNSGEIISFTWDEPDDIRVEVTPHSLMLPCIKEVKGILRFVV